MPREPKIRDKGGYWYSEAGGKSRRFGRVGETSQAEALSRLWKALADDEKEPKQGAYDPIPGPEITTPALPGVSHPRSPGVTLNALAERFLQWVKTHRGEKAHAERSRHIARFQAQCGMMKVDAIAPTHIEAFLATLQAQGHALDYIHKHLVSVKAMFNKGKAKGWIPPLDPFATLEPLSLPPKALTESDLPTPQEVQRLIEAATSDMRDMLAIYHATGMRTHELIEARACDYQPKAQTIVLSKHKRSSTLREYRPRMVLLNDEANAIIQTRCQGREHDAIIFPRPSDGKPHSNINIAERFQKIRKRASVRSSITIYSFRHLWISEALMAGVDALMVARMAGTSVKMIESVYGHFRASALASAQALLDEARGRMQVCEKVPPSSSSSLDRCKNPIVPSPKKKT